MVKNLHMLEIAVLVYHSSGNMLVKLHLLVHSIIGMQIAAR